MRRAVSRTLLVFGGAVAGTAAAWAMSAASASADTTLPVPINPAGDVPSLSSAPLLSGVGDALGLPQLDRADIAPRLSDPRTVVTNLTGKLGRLVHAPEGKTKLDEVGDQAKDAVDGFGEKVAGQFGWLPKELPTDALGQLPTAGHEIGGVLDASPVAQPAGLPVGAMSTTTITETAPVAAVPDTATDRALGDGMSRRGSPLTVLHHFPFGPQGPLTPASVPGAPASGGHCGTTDGGQSAVALPWSTCFAGSTGSTSLRTVGQFVPTTVGAQPGVTPD